MILADTRRHRPRQFRRDQAAAACLTYTLMLVALASGCAGPQDQGHLPLPASSRQVFLELPADQMPLTTKQRMTNLDAFELVWRTVRDRHWDPELGGLDWLAIHDELAPLVLAATTARDARRVLSDLLARLEASHFGIVPSQVYEALLPDHQATSDGRPQRNLGGHGELGIELRMVNEQALVFRVATDSPAAVAGVRPGWQLISIDGHLVEASRERILAQERSDDDPGLPADLVNALMRRLGGSPGDRVELQLEAADGTQRQLTLILARPTGTPTSIGHMPTHYFRFEQRELPGGEGYIHFNMFMDPSRLAQEFAAAVEGFREAPGIVIDLRGNPGGIGGMVMGMSGWFIDEPGQILGSMRTRTGEVRFLVNPRVEPYVGPLVILVDEMTGSTAEIFAQGMQDLGRAHVVGRRTMGAALPSIFERLPNGDGFQYAVADYESVGGTRIEGRGVQPDEVVDLTRAELLAGRDPALDAAVNWLRSRS